MTRRDIAKKLKEYALSDCHNLMLGYLDQVIRDLRSSNDTADHEDVLRNQGAIRHMKQMRKEVAEHEEILGRDGAYTP